MLHGLFSTRSVQTDGCLNKIEKKKKKEEEKKKEEKGEKEKRKKKKKGEKEKKKKKKREEEKKRGNRMKECMSREEKFNLPAQTHSRTYVRT